MYLCVVVLLPQRLYLSRIKNRHGHWVCWDVDGSKNDLIRTLTRKQGIGSVIAINSCCAATKTVRRFRRVAPQMNSCVAFHIAAGCTQSIHSIHSVNHKYFIIFQVRSTPGNCLSVRFISAIRTCMPCPSPVAPRQQQWRCLGRFTTGSKLIPCVTLFHSNALGKYPEIQKHTWYFVLFCEPFHTHKRYSAAN